MNPSIVSALLVMGGLGVLFGAGLAIASKIFAVQKDPRVAAIEEALPGANCGACGAPGCSGFAEGVVEGKYKVNGCIVGGADVAKVIAGIMGTETSDITPQIAVVQCRGDKENSVERASYEGIQTCKAATLVANGPKGCIYGCLGFGDCVASCPFDAIHMGDNGLPVVDEDKCTGCGNCVKACPRGIMALLDVDQKVYLACVSKDFGKSVKSVCKVGCIGCSMCANPKNTAEGLITMNGKLPVIHYDKLNDPWKDLENAVNKCPAKCFGTRNIPESEISETEEKEQ